MSDELSKLEDMLQGDVDLETLQSIESRLCAIDSEIVDLLTKVEMMIADKEEKSESTKNGPANACRGSDLLDAQLHKH